MKKTGEQLVLEKIKSKSEYFMYLRHLALYNFSKKFIRRNHTCLDAGCGEGFGANTLSNFAKKVIAIDANKKAIAHAKKKYSVPNLIFKSADVTNLPFKENTFDFIISSQVIEHIKNEKKYLSELKRVLKKTGTLIISTPNRIYRLNPGQKPWNRFHIREYSQKQLNNALKNHFESINFYGVDEPNQTKNLELNRIKKIRKIVKLDILGFRKIIPDSLKELIKKLLNKEKTSFPKRYSIKDFNITEDSKNSLDLIALIKN